MLNLCPSVACSGHAKSVILQLTFLFVLPEVVRKVSVNFL